MKNTKLLPLALLLAITGTSTAFAATPTTRADLSGLAQDQGQNYQRLIVRYRAGTAAQQGGAALTQVINGVARSSLARSGGAAPQARYLRRIGGSQAHVVKLSRGLSRREVENLILDIAADPNVEYVGVDVLHQPTATASAPNDPKYPDQWHYFNPTGGINAPVAWSAGADGSGVVVAVLDTGVTTHSDLAANLLPGYDMISDADVSGRTTDARVPGGADLGDWVKAGECGAGSRPANSSWHGTHVTGTIAEVSNNGIGMAGVAPQAKVVPVRVLGHCGGYTSDILDGITWASGGHVDGVPDNPNPAEVINMSLSGAQQCSVEYQATIDAAVARGTTIVVAAGNDSIDAMNKSPANCKNVITVGSTGISGKRAGYSNFGLRVDLAAPGGGVSDGANQNQGYVWSTWNEGTTTPAAESYVGMVGTSMAAPHVAGIVALMQSVALQPLSPLQVASLLKQSARAFPTMPDRPMGVGIVDAGSAVVAVKTGGTVLANGVIKPGLAGVASQAFVYVMPVGDNVARLTVTSYGGSGQVKLPARRDGTPTDAAYDAVSQRPGNNQILTINAPAPGTYYIKLVGVTDFSGVSLKATAQ